MDHFEGIIKTILEQEGYWVRQSFKVNLTKPEKRTLGKHSMPRPEIDLLLFKPTLNRIIVLEVKSFLDSTGVKLDDLMVSYKEPTGRYKQFTCSIYRRIVFNRLREDLKECGMASGHEEFQLGLAAGKIYKNQSDEIAELFHKKGWLFLPPHYIRSKLMSLARKGYQNDAAFLAAKVLDT